MIIVENIQTTDFIFLWIGSATFLPKGSLQSDLSLLHTLFLSTQSIHMVIEYIKMMENCDLH